jgi:leader peptidase (prepilin peptidase)/N-methyltransferase
MAHVILILFFFILGSCVGSFLNVVVWRLPRVKHSPESGWIGTFLASVQGLSNPPSHCPRCNEPIRWYDNIPVIGWIKLGGKCRFCHNPISARYPIVEAATGLLFAFYYIMFFIAQVGPCAPTPALIPHPLLGTALLIPRPLIFQIDWPIYLLDMALISALLAASLIDWELFIIPIEIPWLIAVVGLIVHASIDRPSLAGALNTSAVPGALAAGGGVGLIISMILLRLGLLPQTFPDDEPMQDVSPDALLSAKRQATGERDQPAEESEQEHPIEYTRMQIYAEIAKEILFLLPPLLLALGWWLATTHSPGLSRWWQAVMMTNWISGLLGAVLGALIGGLVVWLTRIFGTLAFGRLAMGLGDVHLMFGVGAVIGAAGATIAFFLAPFFGIATAIYLWLSGNRRELPYGPYLSMASGFVLLFGCPIIAWMSPGMDGLRIVMGNWLGRG